LRTLLKEGGMNFETAIEVSRDVERSFPGLMVGGFRRLARDRRDSWAIDIVDPDSGRMVTLDEKDDWDRVLEINFPELSRSQ
jgi:hypothetical protein